MADRDIEYFRSREVADRDPVEHFDREQHAAYEGMPPVNVLIAGPTGVGKSTLVNAVLRKPVGQDG
jgi:predicted GTPase